MLQLHGIDWKAVFRIAGLGGPTKALTKPPLVDRPPTQHAVKPTQHAVKKAREADIKQHQGEREQLAALLGNPACGHSRGPTLSRVVRYQKTSGRVIELS
jgi:hypothetical protein